MNLDELRMMIDDADRELLSAFEKRMAVSEKIGELKKTEGRDVFDPAREEKKYQELKKIAGAKTKPYVEELYGTVFDISRKQQEKRIFGVLGRSLPHTYSPLIHNLLEPSYSYTVIPKEPEELDALFEGSIYSGFNVTIPYKKEAAARCAYLSPEAEATGAVNTVVRSAEGCRGFNTDIYGFKYMITRQGIDPRGKKCLILGHGGASEAVSYALSDMGAREIVFAARREEINFENVSGRCPDAQFIINCTPVGMYPEADASLIDLREFPSCEAAADLIYNPSRTRFLQDAQELGIKTAGGLSMLVAQAWKASRIFLGHEDTDEAGEDDIKKIEEVISLLQNDMKNITLIGMPGSGKTNLAKEISRLTGRPFIDLDIEYAKRFGEKPSDTIKEEGEDAFREKESLLASEMLLTSGNVISCGGGIVTRDGNRFFVKANSTVIYLKRPIESLASEDRPLTAANGVQKLYEQRRGNYESWSDLTLQIGMKETKNEFLNEASELLRERGIIR